MFFTLLIGLFLIATIIITWINLFSSNKLNKEITYLKSIIFDLISLLEKKGRKSIDFSSIKKTLSSLKEPRPESSFEIKEVIEIEKIAEVKKAPSNISTKRIIKKQTPKKRKKINLEEQFATKLPVWIGGIALALASLFMVKYSIEKNLLSPEIRVTLGGLFGFALLVVSNFIHNKPKISNSIRIVQALSGAGITALYGSLFAATSVYALLPSFVGFIAMAIVTIIAVVLSLRHGLPIAVLGLIGGFMTPALIGIENLSSILLFSYIYFVFSALVLLINNKDWWTISIPSLIGVFSWVIVWLFSDFAPNDNVVLTLFLVGIIATIFFFTKDKINKSSPSVLLNRIGIGFSVILVGFIGQKSGFAINDWIMFGLISIAGIALAWFDKKLYSFVPWISMIVNMVMLAVWEGKTLTTIDNELYAIVMCVFAILYIIPGIYFVFRIYNPKLWAVLVGFASVGYYLLAYYKLHETNLFESISFFWGGLALVFALISAHLCVTIKDVYKKHKNREVLISIFTVISTIFISLGLTIELEKEFLSVAIILQTLVLAWINSKVSIKVLKSLIQILVIIFLFLLLPQVLLLIQLTAFSLVEAKLNLQASIPIVKWPLFQLGIPAIATIGTSYLLRLKEDSNFVRFLEFVAIALTGVMGYYLMRHAFYIDKDILFAKANFFERGIMTNVLFVYGLFCFIIGRYFNRKSFSFSGIILSGIALFRILYFDFYIDSPLYSHHQILGVTGLNSLLLPYGIPILWIFFINKELKKINMNLNKFLGGLALLFAFALINLNVREFFHPEFLDIGNEMASEIYSYSVAWLLFGIGLLIAGIIKKNQMIRYVSLAVMILTVGKVFIYDASELDGLYRVFSFLGLGVSLIGLSYFYTKFVFEDKNKS